MVFYNLEHLSQEDRQEVSGPIQDDEALFMFAIIRGMQIETVLEIGGLNGYSARNFLAAVGPEGTVFTCDVNPVVQIANNHVVLIKNGIELDPSDLKQSRIELLFFDCHDYDAQMKILSNLQKNKMLADRVVLVLHDTNTHPYQSVPWAFETTDGYVHQVVERQMVNDLVADGWHAFSLHTDSKKLLTAIPYRHGVTVLTKFVKFDNGLHGSAVSVPKKKREDAALNSSAISAKNEPSQTGVNFCVQFVLTKVLLIRQSGKNYTKLTTWRLINASSKCAQRSIEILSKLNPWFNPLKFANCRRILYQLSRSLQSFGIPKHPH